VRIVSISSSRADVGILKPVWRALCERGADLHIIATGMHRAPRTPRLALDGIRATLHETGSDLGGRADAAATTAMADIAAGCGALYAGLAPDVVLVMGDRLDMLPAATASLPFNIPLAHLHGGEVTEGAIDDRVRHAMSKLSQLHLVSCESARQCLLSMGEDDAKIVVTGAPGLDTLLAAPQMSRAEFLREVGLDAVAGSEKVFILATVHPETNAPDPIAPMTAVLAALDELRLPVLFTAPNNDPGGAEMKQVLAAWIASRACAVHRDTLGSRLYPNALRHAAAMVGNSSSGIIEAGLFGLPVVDVGDRQKGRERGGNVVPVGCGPDVAQAIRDALDGGRLLPESPYGQGGSGPLVAEALFDRFGVLGASRRKTSQALEV
jgi:UDP-hydrolysing UDP-N-acetyl-D-glucosamine 2-epimerase